MSIWITEHQGFPYRMQPAANRPLASYALTSASVGTPVAGAGYIRAIADAGSYLGLYGTTTAALTSTNAFRLAANVPELFAISTSLKIQAAST